MPAGPAVPASPNASAGRIRPCCPVFCFEVFRPLVPAELQFVVAAAAFASSLVRNDHRIPTPLLII
jgi:hypothetical protein